MSAYILVRYDVVDPKGYQSYVEGVLPLLAKHGAEILVVEQDAVELEGEKQGTYIVLKFDSEESALAWYNDPDYASVKKLRLDSAKNNNMVLARGFVPPEG